MLAKRLNVVLDYIDPTDKFADIGCDHGYLALYAIKKGVKFLQLIDNKKMPLNKALENLDGHLDKAFVLFTLASGLTKLHELIDTVAICGMGGDLISNILNERLDKAKKLKKIILQPNSKVDNLRYFLSLNKFLIVDEKIIFERNKYYQIIVVKYDESSKPLNNLEIKYGPILLKKKDIVFINYLKQRLLLNKETLLKYGKIDKLNEEIKEIEEILDYENN